MSLYNGKYDMSVQIKLHTTEDYPEFILKKSLDFETKSLHKWTTGGLLKNELGALYARAKGLEEAFQLAIKLGKPKAECLRYLKLSLECYVTAFNMANHPGELCDCEINGHRFQKVGDYSQMKASVWAYWGDAFDQALMLRDQAAIKVLSAVSESVLEKYNGSIELPHFIRSEYRLLKTLYNPKASLQQCFQGLMNSLADHQLGESIFHHILQPRAFLLGDIFSPHQEEYQSQMAAALELHRAYFMEDEESVGLAGGWLATRLCSMAALAYEHKGWVFEYDTDPAKAAYQQEYLPRWLITGDFS